jgi:predicted dehydrogenase
VKSVKIGILGAGNIGRVHIESLQRVMGAEVVAVADTDTETAAAAREKYSIPEVFSDYRKLLKLPDVDAVFVCTPNVFHKEMVINSVRAGKHVFCEKPMALNAAEAKKMVVAAREKKRILFMGFCNRFHGKSRGLKEMIEAGKLGDIYHSVVSVTRRRGVPAIGGWFTQKSQAGGGALIDIGVHMLDLTLWLMGFPKPVSISGAAYSKFGHRKDYVYTSMWGEPVPGGKFDVDDYATAFVRFDNGATLTLECSWAANIPQMPWTSYLMGDKGGARFDFDAGLEIYTEDSGFIADVKHQFARQNNYVDEDAHFIACVQGKEKPMCTGEQGLTVQQIIDGIYKSSETGREVRIK